MNRATNEAVTPDSFKRPRAAWLVPGALLLSGLTLLVPGQDTQLHARTEFTIKELFGVSHPAQIVDFDHKDPVDSSTTYMIGPDGTEVPYQVLSTGKIAVQATLDPGAQQTWKLVKGRAPGAFNGGVRLTEQTAFYEITNGITGVRVLRPAGNSGARLAPIQGIQLRSGAWTSTGPNYIYSYVNWNPAANPSILQALTVNAKVIESGPLKATVQVSYTYNRPDLYSGSVLAIQSGAGFYRSTITLEAGQPSIEVFEDTDMDLQYYLNAYSAIQPDMGRYRGHSAENAEEGVDAKGNVYVGYPGMSDGFRKLPYTSSFPNDPFFRQAVTWNPWAQNTGWYWMLYNSSAVTTAPVLGAYSGKASLALGLNASGAGVYTMMRDMNGQKAAGLSFRSSRRSADGVVSPRVRMFWAIYAGTKGDLGDPYTVQNIGRQMNVHGGITLNKVHRYPASFADPPNGYNSLYLPGTTVTRIIQQVRTNDAYYQWLYSAEPTARPLLDMWRDNTGTVAQQQQTAILRYARELLDTFVNKNGIYDFEKHYWMGGLDMSRYAVFINDLLMRNQSSGMSRDKLKAAAVLFASILWDDDFVPLQDKTALNLGTPNMPIQEVQYRNLYTMLLSFTPMMAGRAMALQAGVLENIRQVINPSGSHISSPHYITASMGPLLSTMQQLKVNSGFDAFKSEPRMARFANFYMDLLTPPEPRFGGWRKLAPLGDGSAEASELYGQLGTAFADLDPALSGRLMQAWKASGQVESGFHGTTILKIDDTLPAAPLNLTSAAYPGYYSVLRHGFGTPNESAVWFINGSFYRDHRHEDLGSATIYALNTPLSLDWGSTYSPRVEGAYMHNLVLPESALSIPWDAGNVPLGSPENPWRADGQERFEAFDFGSQSRMTFLGAKGSTWTRQISTVYGDAGRPLIHVRDTFSGSNAGANKIATFNFMSNASVDTPKGTVVPPLRLFDGDHKTELPSSSPSISLDPGVSRFQFTGQWTIDWDLYVESPRAQQVVIGNWSHAWHPDRETAEFARANGRPFRERQNIFRLRGAGPFNNLIVPYRKGESSPTLTVTPKESTLSVVGRGQQTILADDYCAFQGRRRTVLTAFGGTAAAANGIRIQGGPAEVVIEGKQVIIVAHGAAGRREITLPGSSWVATSASVSVARGTVTFTHNGRISRVVLTRAVNPDQEPAN